MLDNWRTTPHSKWKREDVRKWLRSENIDHSSVEKLYEGKITGADVKHFDEMFLRGLGIKDDQIKKILKVHDKLKNAGDYGKIKAKEKQLKPLISKPLDLKIKTITTSASDNSDTGNTECTDSTSSGQSVLPVSIPSVSVSQNTGTDCLLEPCSSVEVNPFEATPATVCITEPQELILDSVSLTSHDLADRVDDCKTNNCNPRNFDHPEDNIVYKLNSIIPPEIGVDDMIRPCREFKALSIQERNSDEEILKGVAYFSEKVINFAAGCINARSNGTIYFGVRDKFEKHNDICYAHGQVTGLYVKDKDLFISRLTESIKNCFGVALVTTVNNCIRPIRFIRVIGEEPHSVTEKIFVIEIDVVPSSEHTLKGVFPIVKLPKIIPNKKWNYESIPERILIRHGDSTSPRTFVDMHRDVDSLFESRVTAEKRNLLMESAKLDEEISELDKRRIRILLTKNKDAIDKSISYILVTNKCQLEDLESLQFLSNLKLTCVFDFDPNSNVSGLCLNFRKDSPTSKLHTLSDYFAQDDVEQLKQFVEHFKQTSWVFCSGREDIPNCNVIENEKSWIKMESKKVSKAIQLLCDYPLPFERMVILFLVNSTAMILPLKITLTEFYKHLGLEHIVCISEKEEWLEDLVDLTYFDSETLKNRSIIGLKLRDVSLILGAILPDSNFERRLATSNGTYIIKSRDEEMMASLEIIKANELDNTDKSELERNEIQAVERAFYRGDQITWKHLWLAENRPSKRVIKRNTFYKISNIIQDVVDGKNDTVTQITIYHQPGSGGSTVTRQILWKYRKKFRCAVIKSLYLSTEVAKHAFDLRNFGESNQANCVPVLLLLDLHQEYSEADYLSTLKRELRNLVSGNRLSFIIFVCKQDMNPKSKVEKVSPHLAFDVVHELYQEEESLFSNRVKNLKEEYNVSLNTISSNFEPSMLTFVLMAKEFKKEYVIEMVHNVLKRIKTSTRETSLIKYVALLHSFGRNSTLSKSHCEAFMHFDSVHFTEEPLKSKTMIPEYDKFKDSLSEQANFLFKFVIDSSTNLEFVQIVHVKVAEEVLSQLAEGDQYSTIALNLLKEDILIQHKPLRTEFKKMMVTFFLRREKDIKGRRFLFSPFIEYICEKESKEIAVKIAELAYSYLGPKQGPIAQMIARLFIHLRNFEKSREWIQYAKSDFSKPNSGILHTEGKIYQEWFYTQLQNLEQDTVTLSEAYPLVTLALTAMNRFMESQDAATSNELSNNYTYYDHVETSCQLLNLLTRLTVFHYSDEPACSCKLIRYLFTSFIPQELDSEENWKSFHAQLKSLVKTVGINLDQVSIEVCCFQKSWDNEDDTEAMEYDENTIEYEYSSDEEHKKWLHRWSKEFAMYLVCDNKEHENNHDVKATNQIQIYKLGGGTVSDILSMLSENDSAKKLEELLNLYDLDKAKRSRDPTNQIFVHLALSCTKSDKYCSLKELQKQCSFCQRHETFSHGYYFLRMMLHWPGCHSHNPKTQYQIVNEAIHHLRILYKNRRKQNNRKKQQVYTAFFLGNGTKFNEDMFIHKNRLQKLLGTCSRDTRQQLWRSGEVWQNPKVQRILQRVSGWSSGGDIFVKGHTEKSQIKVHPMNMPGWLHNSDESLSFYLGFSFDGPVVFDVQSENV